MAYMRAQYVKQTSMHAHQHACSLQPCWSPHLFCCCCGITTKKAPCYPCTPTGSRHSTHKRRRAGGRVPGRRGAPRARRGAGGPAAAPVPPRGRVWRMQQLPGRAPRCAPISGLHMSEQLGMRHCCGGIRLCRSGVLQRPKAGMTRRAHALQARRSAARRRRRRWTCRCTTCCLTGARSGAWTTASSRRASARCAWTDLPQHAQLNSRLLFSCGLPQFWP